MMKKTVLHTIIATAATAVGLAASTPAFCYDADGVAKVTLIEVTYMPRTILFRLDKAIGSCQPGTWIFWDAQGADKDEKDKNAQAILSTLLTARTTGMPVNVHLTSAGCKAEYLYL